MWDPSIFIAWNRSAWHETWRKSRYLGCRGPYLWIFNWLTTFYAQCNTRKVQQITRNGMQTANPSYLAPISTWFSPTCEGSGTKNPSKGPKSAFNSKLNCKPHMASWRAAKKAQTWRDFRIPVGNRPTFAKMETSKTWVESEVNVWIFVSWAVDAVIQAGKSYDGK